MLGRPLHVVPAHPLQPHRLADGLRDDDGLVLGAGAAAVRAAVVARAVEVADDDLVGGVFSIIAISQRIADGFALCMCT